MKWQLNLLIIIIMALGLNVKSVYHRKYDIENVRLELSSEFNINVSVELRIR